MSASRSSSQVTTTSNTRSSQIKQVAQRVSSRLRDKHLMESQQIQSSSSEYSSATFQPKSGLVRTSIPEKPMKVVNTPGHKALSFIAIHTTKSDASNPQHYHPHNVDRR